MLPPGQFGGRPGRNTSDAMHMVTHKIKNVWRSGNVAAALFLDVQGAFPNTVQDRLLYNMRECGVPKCYVNLTRRMLTSRRTRLKFDDFVSELIDILNSTTQGCPLTMLFYTFYNAPLIRTAIPTRKSELSIGFIDDSMLLAIAKTLHQAHVILRDMVERCGGCFDWSISHNSPFELSKLAFMDFPHSILDIIPPPLVLTRRNPDGSTSRQIVSAQLPTTAGDVLDVYSDLLPVDLLYHKILFRPAVCLASLPASHPLHGPSRKAAKRCVKRHHSPLHNLFLTMGVDPTVVEVIAPTQRRPNFVASFKPQSQSTAMGLRREYCPATHHTEAEIVGLTLGLHLLTSLSRLLRSLTVIGSDSQAVIRALHNQRPHPARYLLDHAHSAAEKLHVKQDRITRGARRKTAIHWVSGHVDFAPNERADKITKEAAQGTCPMHLLPPYLRCKPLSASIPALRQEHLTALRKTWRRCWEASPRFSLINAIDASLSSKKFLKLIEHLDRRHSAILAQLCTGHSPLHQHLFRIRQAESPQCPYCRGLSVETVRHFLLICPYYRHERHVHLRRKLRCKAEYLISAV
ncbi:putative encoded by [Lyophyllum shimeji]|uniref:Encoded by n=1 Tax=Lyophyllum shimeji TaxID=47721 RepID=A0A9P3PU65_LYOSH|nr:putative encoded by [Lyophyllum shimeji]